MAFQDSLNCISYKPGHNPHELYVGKSRSHQRFPAMVHLIGPQILEVELAAQRFELYHHLAIEVYLRTLCLEGAEALYAPQTQLLYLPSGENSWIVAHLAREEDLSPCLPRDPRSQQELRRWLEAEGL